MIGTIVFDAPFFTLIISQWPVQLSMLFWSSLFSTVFFQSHSLLSHIITAAKAWQSVVSLREDWCLLQWSSSILRNILISLLKVFYSAFNIILVISQWQLIIIFMFSWVEPFLHIYSFWHTEEKSLRKTLWEKVKLLIKAISPFPQCFLINLYLKIP